MKAAITYAFVGQSQRIFEACLAGGVAGASIAFAKKKILQGADSSVLQQPGVPDVTPLIEFEPNAPQICHELVRLVKAFLPSRVHITVNMVQNLLDMATCYEAIMVDAREHAEAVYFSYLLSSRVRDTVSELSLLFPCDSPANRRACELCQSIFDIQDALNCEIKGIARLMQL